MWVTDHLKRSLHVRGLEQGDYFGEVALIYSTPRTATVKSSNYCTLASLNSKSFLDLCNNFPEILEKMRERALKHDDPWKKFKAALLSKIEYFEEQTKDPEFLEEIIYSMQEEYIEKGIEIASPDQDMEQIIFIVEGRADVVVYDQEGNEKIIDILNQGDVIGQYSALSSE